MFMCDVIGCNFKPLLQLNVSLSSRAVKIAFERLMIGKEVKRRENAARL
jgi:hypothetical protein